MPLMSHSQEVLNRRGVRVDRTGRGPIAEVYPKASRHRWELLDGPRRMDALLAATPWLRCDAPTMRAYDVNEHAFDALVCALTARAVACGLTACPEVAQLDDARLEGWIHLPVPGSLALLPHHEDVAPMQRSTSTG